MNVLSTFSGSSLNFLFNNIKKILQNLVQSVRKAVSKFELPETQTAFVFKLHGASRAFLTSRWR